MSLFDDFYQAALKPQVAIYSDPIFFQDEVGDYTIESKGVFKSQFTLVDSITQQEIVSEVPTLWVVRPTVIPMAQGLRVKYGDLYYQIKEIHNDSDHDAYNLLLHEIEAPTNGD